MQSPVRASLAAGTAHRAALHRSSPRKRRRTFLAEALERRLALTGAPSILSITRASPAGSETGADSVAYTATFSEPVVGVDAHDFRLALDGVTATTPLTVSGSGAVYTVTVNGIAGTGTLGVNFVDDGSVHNLEGNRLRQPNERLAFGDPQSFGVGSLGQSFVVADLNVDGKPDIITRGNPVSVLLGNGDGTFTPAGQSLPNAVSFQVADVNLDGKPDLLVIGGPSGVGVMLGKGDGTFLPLKSISVGTQPDSMLVGDVNGDTRPDLIVDTIQYGDKGGVLLGNGDGTFQPKVPISLIAGSNTLLFAADLNSDGKCDLLLNYINAYAMTELLSKGDGTFQYPQSLPIGSGSRVFAAADMNGDGKTDLLLSDNSNSAIILLGNGDGTFQPQAAFSTGYATNSLAVADLNDDGKLDLVTTFKFSDGLRIHLGNGDGTFQPPIPFTTSLYPGPVAVADVNGDGRPDVITGQPQQSSMTVMLGTGHDSYTGPLYTITHPLPSVRSIARTTPAGPLIHTDTVTYTVTFTQPVTGVDLSDFALVLNGTTGQMTQVTPVSDSVYTVTLGGISGSGTVGLNLVDDGSIHNLVGAPLVSFDGSFTPSQVLATGPSPSYLAAADANADGNQDFFVVNLGDSTVSQFLGNGDGTFQTLAPFAAGISSPYYMYTADFNQDGRPDLLDGWSGVLFLGNGDGTYKSPMSGIIWRPLCIADVNGDGFPDLMSHDFFDYRGMEVSLGRGDGTFRPPIATPLAAGSFSNSFAACDMNHDGIPDLVASSDKVVSVLFGRGDGTFQLASSQLVSLFSGSMAIADVNHDGFQDVVLNNYPYNISVLLGNGDGTLQPAIATESFTYPSSLVLTDLNSDGNLDAVISGTTGGMRVFLGNGDGTFQPLRTLAPAPNAIFGTFADVNHDGRPDLIFNGSRKNTSTVSLNSGNGNRNGEVYAVNSATPSVNSFALGAGVEGASTSPVMGSFTGQPQDTFTATVNYGSGYTSYLPLSGNDFTLSYTYAEAGTYTVTVVVTDTTAGLVSAPMSATIIVSDASVQAAITGAPATIALGGSVNLNFTATNPNKLEMGPLVESWTIQDGSSAVVASGTGGPYTFTPAAAGTYTVTFTAGESAAADSETGTATATITVNPAAPTLTSTAIDDGSKQRSLIRSLTFSFSSPVTLSAGAITLALLNTAGSNSGTNDGSPPTDASAALGVPTSPDGGLTWVVPIQATSARSALGSLTDGIYSATVHASLVTDSYGQPLSGGDPVKTFHRLFGDVNGDKRVNATDYQQFSAAFGSSNLTANYSPYFDFNHDGRVNATDYQQFSSRFGKSFIYVG